MRLTPGQRERLQLYALLMRLDKPIGIALLLWPCLWALWIAAEGVPDFSILLIFVLGVVLMRSAGCVMNDFADRGFDPHVQRTRERPIASGRVSEKEALWLFVGLCLFAFILVLFLNRLTLYMSFIAVALAVLYPFMKRHTYLPQVVLGLAFGWSVPMAFAAQAGTVPEVAWLLLAATVLWATAYDTIYAMMDREDDVLIGVKSTAILFGEADRFIIGIIQAALIVTLALIGSRLGLSFYYYLGVLAAAGLSIYQQYLIRNRETAACLRAFRNNGWLGAVVFAGLLLHYAM